MFTQAGPGTVSAETETFVYDAPDGETVIPGDYRLVLRTGLKGKRKVGQWEAYNVVKDPNETTNLAEKMPELIDKAKAIFASQWTKNAIFPVDRTRALQ